MYRVNFIALKAYKIEANYVICNRHEVDSFNLKEKGKEETERETAHRFVT